MLCVLSPVLAGCEKQSEPVVQLRPLIEWQQVSTASVGEVAEGYTHLSAAGTDGLFPASMAVARVTVQESGDGAGEAVLDMHPPNDMLPWNSLFDDLPYVSDAFPLSERDLSGDAPAPERLLSAASNLSAGLCLVYGCSDPTLTESRVRGVIFDTHAGTPLAAIQAEASVVDPDAVPHPPELVEDDRSYVDPRVLADERFRHLVYECIRDLKRRDRAVAPQKPDGWTPDGPIFPRTWPPLPTDTR